MLQTGRLIYSHTRCEQVFRSCPPRPAISRESLRPAHHVSGGQKASLSPALCLLGHLAGLLLAAGCLPRSRRPLGNRHLAPGLEGLDHGARPREQVGRLDNDGFPSPSLQPRSKSRLRRRRLRPTALPSLAWRKLASALECAAHMRSHVCSDIGYHSFRGVCV